MDRQEIEKIAEERWDEIQQHIPRKVEDSDRQRVAAESEFFVYDRIQVFEFVKEIMGLAKKSWPSSAILCERGSDIGGDEYTRFFVKYSRPETDEEVKARWWREEVKGE